ncbi:hypothetical protein [Pseudooceanicola sp.]|uniref:hypothetical protein n=1 Tax=Pseudooceanicola sp. TaxID=1914328 RepID=UPI0035145C43
MSDYLADRYARSQREPFHWAPSAAVILGVAAGLALFVAIFHDAPARAARNHIAAERLIGASW